jgi:hypothetical protein
MENSFRMSTMAYFDYLRVFLLVEERRKNKKLLGRGKKDTYILGLIWVIFKINFTYFDYLNISNLTEPNNNNDPLLSYSITRTKYMNTKLTGIFISQFN